MSNLTTEQIQELQAIKSFYDKFKQFYQGDPEFRKAGTHENAAKTVFLAVAGNTATLTLDDVLNILGITCTPENLQGLLLVWTYLVCVAYAREGDEWYKNVVQIMDKSVEFSDHLRDTYNPKNPRYKFRNLALYAIKIREQGFTSEKALTERLEHAFGLSTDSVQKILTDINKACGQDNSSRRPHGRGYSKKKSQNNKENAENADSGQNLLLESMPCPSCPDSGKSCSTRCTKLDQYNRMVDDKLNEYGSRPQKRYYHMLETGVVLPDETIEELVRQDVEAQRDELRDFGGDESDEEDAGHSKKSGYVAPEFPGPDLLSMRYEMRPADPSNVEDQMTRIMFFRRFGEQAKKQIKSFSEGERTRFQQYCDEAPEEYVKRAFQIFS